MRIPVDLDRIVRLAITAALVVIVVSTAVQGAPASPAASDGRLIGDRFVFEATTGDEKTEVTATRLVPWIVQNPRGQAVHVSPLHVAVAPDGSADIWLQDLRTHQPVGAMSIRPAFADEASALTTPTREGWSHKIAYSSEPTAAHCLDVLSSERNEGPCHLAFSDFWRAENHGTSAWDMDADVPVAIASGSVEWTLKSFQRGTNPYPSTAEHGPARQFVASEQVPWGIIDENVTHPFPLSYAFDQTTKRSAISVGTNYVEWKESQRSPFPVSGALEVVPRAGGSDLAWRVVVQGDASYLTITSRMPFFVSHENDFKLSLTLPDDSVEETPGTWSDVKRAPSSVATWPRLDEMVARVWNSSFPGAPPLSAWAFAESCPDDCPTDEALATLTFSARDYRATHAEPAVTDYWSARLWMRPSGEVVELEHTSAERFEPTLAPQAATFATQPGSTAARDVLTLGIVSCGAILAWFLWKHAAAIFGFAMGKTRRPESETRQRVRDLVAAEPGIHFREIVRRMDISNGTAVYHLETLLRRGKVRAEQRGGYRCFFPAEPGSHDVDAILALKAAGARRIADALREGPMEIALLGVATGLRYSTIAYHVGKMASAGLLEIRTRGRARQFLLTESARRLIS